MSAWTRGWSGSLLALDRAFDAAANLLRVLLRGKFRPDGRSFRESHFVELMPKELFLEEVDLNAADADEARRIVELEPERYLALEPPAGLFDISGPVETPALGAGSVERRYLLGITRREVLEAAHLEKNGFLIAAEGFTFHPPDYPGHVLLFRDETCDRRRRMRRVLLLAASLAVAWGGFDAYQTWNQALEKAELAAKEEQSAALQRIRRLEGQLAEARKALAGAAAVSEPPEVPLATLATVSRLQPPDAELSEVRWTVDGLSVEGRSYAPAATELAFRRGFAGNRLIFQSLDAGTPASFSAKIDRPTPTEGPGDQPISARTAP